MNDYLTDDALIVRGDKFSKSPNNDREREATKQILCASLEA